jgi:sec-independent protein translocase protein TatA
MNVGPLELLIILAVVLLLFGSTRLPKLARSMGQASKEFRQGLKEGATDAPEDQAAPTTPTTPTTPGEDQKAT